MKIIEVMDEGHSDCEGRQIPFAYILDDNVDIDCNHHAFITFKYRFSEAEDFCYVSIPHSRVVSIIVDIKDY